MEQARQAERLEEHVKDSASKVDLLNGEIAFNGSLGATLEQLRAIQATLDVAQRATLDGQLAKAVDLLVQVEGELASVSVSPSTRVVGLFEVKVTNLRNHAIEKLKERWYAYIQIDPSKSAVTIKKNLDSKAVTLYFLNLR